MNDETIEGLKERNLWLESEIKRLRDQLEKPSVNSVHISTYRVLEANYEVCRDALKTIKHTECDTYKVASKALFQTSECGKRFMLINPKQIEKLKEIYGDELPDWVIVRPPLTDAEYDHIPQDQRKDV